MNCNEDILHNESRHAICDDYDDFDCDGECCYAENEQ